MKYLPLCLPLLVAFPACSGSNEASDTSSEHDESNDEADDDGDESDYEEEENARPDAGASDDDFSDDSSDQTSHQQSEDDSDAEITNEQSNDEPVYQDREKALSMRPATSLALTSQGTPRLLSILKGPNEDERMVTYLECDENCTQGAEQWNGTVISNHNDIAAGIDIALDAKDRPRVVYNLGYSIFTASCDSGKCAAAPTEWAIGPVELTSEMPPDQIILWPNCNVDAWMLHNPTLAVSPDGKPRVAYQASDVSGGGVANPDPNQTPCLAGTDMSWSRMTTLQ